MDPEVTYARLTELTAQSNVRDLSRAEQHEMADLFAALDSWLSRGGFLPRAWKPGLREIERLDVAAPESEPVSVKAEVPLSLGEQPHDPADCFMHRGRPHLGPCLDAEAYTRWYWLDGPGSRPFESTQIALATARLVAEAYQAKEERMRREAEPKPPADTSWLQFDRERPDA